MREREGSARLSKNQGRCSWSQQQSVPVQVDPPEPALLSALPDGVLHIILFFLPAWHAVQTCVLSRRWRDLWCSMPYINIDEREFGVGAYRQIKENWDDFVDFTTNLLLFHRNSVYLDKFQIYAHDSSQQYVDKWIRLGIKYCPSVLEIQIPYYADDLPFKLPHLSSGLSRLKRLRLSNLKLDSHFSELIGSGCPALEDLELTCCLNYFRDIKSSTAMLDRNSDKFPMFPNLRALSLKRCFLDDECDCDMGRKLEDLGSFLQNAPCLEKLTLWCCMFCLDSGLEWGIKRRSICLKSQDGKTFPCLILKLIEVMYEHDHEHLLVELIWGIARRLPDASVKLTKI